MKKLFIFILAGLFLLAGCSAVQTGGLPQVFMTMKAGSFVDSNGDLYTWGYDQRNVSEGEYFPGLSLGQGTEIVYNNVPTKIYSDVAYVLRLGNRALTKSGEIIEWSMEYENDTCVPHVVRENVAKMDFSLYLTKDGELHTMPQGESKMSTIAYKDCGQLVMTDVKDFAAGYKYFAIKNDGSVWTFLVNGITAEIGEQPQKFMDGVERIVAESTTSAATLFLKTDGSLWACGGNEFGQCGNGQHGDLDTQTYDCVLTEPYKLADHVIDAWASTLTTFYLTEDHNLYACGRNYNDILLTGGDGKMQMSGYSEYMATPTLVMTDVKQIGYSDMGLFVLKTDNTLWSWGYADKGTLGNGVSYIDADMSMEDIYKRTNTGDAQYYQPTKIMDEVKRLFPETVGLHFAEKTDGSIWYWGYGTLYTIGDTIESQGLKRTGVIKEKNYIVPTPIEFSVDTFYQNALDYSAVQTNTEE